MATSALSEEEKSIYSESREFIARTMIVSKEKKVLKTPKYDNGGSVTMETARSAQQIDLEEVIKVDIIIYCSKFLSSIDMLAFKFSCDLK